MRYTLNKNIAIAHFDNDSIVFDSESHDLFKLNHTARHLIQLLLRKKTRSEIVRAFSGSYNIGRGRAIRDINATINNLSKKGIIHEHTGKTKRK
ncbi:PqqD family protein [Candidatus Auribacterota bacterium]